MEKSSKNVSNVIRPPGTPEARKALEKSRREFDTRARNTSTEFDVRKDAWLKAFIIDRILRAKEPINAASLLEELRSSSPSPISDGEFDNAREIVALDLKEVVA